MNNPIRELKSLPFYQIIGAPLLAMVQAEAQAAKATAEFIQSVGFEASPAPPLPSDEDSEAIAPRPQNELGSLRMVTFSYEKSGADGSRSTFRVQIPLLSLIPIPALQIKEASVDFSVQLHDVAEEEVSTQIHDETKKDDPSHFLSRKRMSLRGGLTKQAADHEMKVQVTVQQADVPAGLTALLKLMDQSIHSVNEEEEVPS